MRTPIYGALMFLLGASAGIAGKTIIDTKKHNFIGNLHIDRSEKDEAPKIFLELTTDFKTLQKTKIAKLKIINSNYIK